MSGPYVDQHPCKECGEPTRNRMYCSAICQRKASKNKKHGMAHSLENRNWRNMLDRCRNPRCKYWPSYGGRGITVCERWNEFANFIADMGPKPTDKKRYSIERIDNNKGYEPGNCKWATPLEQSRNRRGNYTQAEDAKIREMIALGYDFTQMGKALGKSKQSVAAHAYRIGLRSGRPPDRLKYAGAL